MKEPKHSSNSVIKLDLLIEYVDQEIQKVT